MEVVAHGRELPRALRGGALALGNFDGVHLGHQAVIAAAREAANGRPTVVGTFEPHPLRLLRPETPPFMLSTVSQKCAAIEALGADAVVAIPFDRTLSEMSARGFAEDWLVRRIGAHEVVTGSNFTFGHNREGDVQTLASLGRKLGFATQALAAVPDESGETISSTRIRGYLRQGKIGEATALLSRPFTIRGQVVHGNALGRTIGVPTANLRLGDYVRPKYGVYATRIRLPDGSSRTGVTNIGIRPMFTPPIELVEVWILDWKGDLYGREIDVALIEYLRPEIKLDGLEALRQQISRDAEQTRHLLG